VTEYCGFPAIEAGKLMGLAPYGNPNDSLPKFFANGWGNREVILPTYPNAAKINVGRYSILMDDVENHKQNEYTEIQKDMAYAIQEATSDRMVELIRKAHEETGEKNIVICGGYGLNCVANYKYWKEFPDLNIYCEPISHDGGTSIGGAKYIWHKVTSNKTPQKQSSVYYGPQYNPNTYEDALDGLEVTDTSYDEVAQLIREGNIVTMYQGRSEGGPRALGNRSILFDPTIKDGKDIVNTVKRREWFRPFACSIKKECVHDWFDLTGREETPHMMYAVKCQDGVEEKIPSVIHVDGTCRIQTVTPEQNEHYYNLIDAFEKLSDVPILFNTSFNLGGDPLVETVEDGVDTLKKSDIEYMYLPEIQKLVHIPN
jgi:carbamoyltransferase